MNSLLTVSTILVCIAFFLPISANINIPPNILKLLLFVVSGILVGLFYGKNNNEIWANEPNPLAPL